MKRSLFIVAALALLLILVLNACATSPAPATPAPQTKLSEASQPTKPDTAPAAASPATTKTEATPVAQTPKYGGALRLALTADVTTWDDAKRGGLGGSLNLTNQELWGGDWTKGSAGGYGTKETDWAVQLYDLFDKKAGWIAESWQINVDNATQQATVVYKIRPGIRWALNPNSEASKLVGGRELTGDDVYASLKQATTDTLSYILRSNPELKNIDITKTGPMEVTIKLPIRSLVTALSVLGDNRRIYPVEVFDRNIDMAEWKNSIGTGPFILTDYVSGSSITFAKNPNYWMNDPIGPGKGNQLPYLGEVQQLIIPDRSTRITAFRTGKIDLIEALTWEEAEQLKKQFPQMPSAEGSYYYPGGMSGYMRTDKAPYNDLRVRRALMMATDFNTIKKDINGNRGIIITFPFDYYKEYADLYVGLDDPELSASVKEQYVYSPDKAKKLLAEAGLPNGFKASVMVMASETSYWEMIASMWAKVGVELAIDVKDTAVRTNIVNTQAFDHFTTGPGKCPVAIYYSSCGFSGVPSANMNMSFVKDPYVEETIPKMRALAVTNRQEAVKLSREMTKYALDQAWAIQAPAYRTLQFWWPWLKNYSGEISVGYFDSPNWAQFIWVDQQLKQSMGH